MKKNIIILILCLPIFVYGQKNPKENPFQKYIRYDNKGNLLESVGLSPDGTVSVRFFNEYDSLNRLTRTYQVDAKTKEKTWINTYSYNNKDELIRRNWYPSEKMILYQYEQYSYDSNGNRVELLRYNDDAELIFRETWEYNSAGELRVHKEEFIKNESFRIIDKG
ncbi:hypothetical protein GXP67_05560 [Rhodocytophaga rosea]|uniref:RHS repeat protein n=1 Tax=Rhodocytophaga rosea TaxID=2704465 RepID=A0A6C0GEK2_9BACT|nr:hypothetical protein [Rhodocytophaga rosea]QHT66172.1 hypothetical protein GXP67_05560 [Rhodocytophaga rosea]